MRKILIFTFLFLAGCDGARVLSNDEIIAVTEKCKVAGMAATVARQFGSDDGLIIGIQCDPTKRLEKLNEQP